MIKLDAPLLLVGAGKMGIAMLEGWLGSGIEKSIDKNNVLVLEPFPSDALTQLGVTLNPRFDQISAASPAVMVLAVKPQMAADILPPLANCLPAHTLVLSILAGTTLAGLKQLLGHKKIIRTMPNTPASIGRGITALCAGEGVSADDCALAESLMLAIGEIAWVDDEALMDAVTAISGSGPAYIFHLVESMAVAGEKLGLTPDVSMKLARMTVSGAGQMLYQLPQSAEQLRVNVTSPNGTTAAALEILMADEGMTKLMIKAVTAAAKRSKELASE